MSCRVWKSTTSTTESPSIPSVRSSDYTSTDTPVTLASFGHLARSFRAREPLIRCLGERLLQGGTAGLLMGLIPFPVVPMGGTYSSFCERVMRTGGKGRGTVVEAED